MPIPAKLAVSMETYHLMTDKRTTWERVESAREKGTDRERWREKDSDLVEQKKQFTIAGQREA